MSDMPAVFTSAAWIDIICPAKADKAVLETLCRKGLAETGSGAIVAGNPYDVCWSTPKGKEAVA